MKVQYYDGNMISGHLVSTPQSGSRTELIVTHSPVFQQYPIVDILIVNESYTYTPIYSGDKLPISIGGRSAEILYKVTTPSQTLFPMS